MANYQESSDIINILLGINPYNVSFLCFLSILYSFFYGKYIFFALVLLLLDQTCRI